MEAPSSNRRKWWRSRWLIALAIAPLFVVTVHIVVDHLTQEPPNYSQVDERLWLGGYVTEPPSGVDSVLNLCETEDPYRAQSHRWEPIRDGEPVPSLDWLREQIRFIETELAAGRTVYVHCRNGVSRSGMVVVAFYMARNGWTRDEAMEFVRSKRPGLRPNPAFLKLLLEWERSLKK